MRRGISLRCWRFVAQRARFSSAASSARCSLRIHPAAIMLEIFLSAGMHLASIRSESRLRHFLQRLPSYCPPDSLELLADQKDGSVWAVVNWPSPPSATVTASRSHSIAASPEMKVSGSSRCLRSVAGFFCLVGSVCCGYAGRHTHCREYCQAIFRTDSSPSASQISAVSEYCASVSPTLLECVGNYSRSFPERSPGDSLHCCDRAEQADCARACRRLLITPGSEQEIMEALIRECGSQPLPQDPLWQCFLGSSLPPAPPDAHPPAPPRPRIDSAKMHCCAKANTSLCRSMCVEISRSWGSQSWQEFDQHCEYNPVETQLISCLADLREPCQLGCRGLSYCSNFNNRPTELFRSCNVQSDQGALSDFRLWSNGSIRMPMMQIPVLDIRSCRPEMWKAVACALQIKPCKSRGSLICRSDCVDILSQCGDRKRFPEGQTPERICDLLSPTDDPEQCIPLHTYMTPSPFEQSLEELVHPCNPNPCPSSHLCEVNRRGCAPETDCLPFFCVPGCKLGEASEFLVPADARVQVPVRSGQSGCFEVCVCGASGKLEKCTTLPCQETLQSCQSHAHGSSFRLDCRLCSCFAGETVCSSRQCLTVESTDEERRAFTGLPCSCADHFVPVCASNGRTYPSACVARCVGFRDEQFVFGSCWGNDPCSPNPCQRNQRCVPRPQVCLTNPSEIPCPQYECASRPSSCDQKLLDPVCDTDNVEHTNLCFLKLRGKTLAYRGHCQDACRTPRAVCGQNGETYTSTCVAFSERVAVDYQGRCQAVGIESEFGSESSCTSVQCPELTSASCEPITPPGACCPVCAGMLRIIWNKPQMNIFAKLNTDHPVTVAEVLRILRLHVSIPQCDVFGYLSIDSELIVLIAPVDTQPTALQVEACSKEAEKIDALINSGSPTLISYVPLSAFLSSEAKLTYIRSSSSSSSSSLTLFLLLALLLLNF
ncbi:hypothetical protein DNTS_004428 [Danionella cerebrum]|uniref:Reversion-inducing cysteine-rich protein with Kazal motifs n=1 Tax=Danionella cerebrum TaxID=2873325 RepID=A0A553R793_9TELE|nr:hypothetical protein DNTS_004428 [Danionella translucida]